MATSTEDSKSGEDSSKFECNICLETATDAVISMCGHLFCWPCIHRWMETRPNNPACPVCKSVIDKEKLIPVYGRGPDGQKDPRNTVPPRPQGQREEVPETRNQGFFGTPFDTGGVNVSFGMFPFFGLGPTFTLQTGRQHGFRRARPTEQDEQRRTMARLMLTLAILFIVMIIIS